MRKLYSALPILIIAILLFGCHDKQTVTESTTTIPVITNPITEPVASEPDITQPEETEPLLQSASLYGIDVTGMTSTEAKSAISDAIANYSLALTVNGREIQISAETLSIALSDDAFDRWFTQTISGVESPVSGLLTFDTSAALTLVRGYLETGVRNANVIYDKESEQFIITAHKDGRSADLYTVKTALTNAVATLSPTATASAKMIDVSATIRDNDPRLPAAVTSANEYLTLDISYTYEAPGITTTTQGLSKAEIGNFIAIDSQFQVQLNKTEIISYVKTVSKQFGSTQRDFVTTHGTTIELTVDYYGAVLDQDKMYEDLLLCLTEKISGNRMAPFLSSSANNMPYGGNYVEIDLTSQYLWLYSNGELVISTPFVSGNVSSGRRTPTGVFSIFGMYTDTYLMGPTWYDYVNYWIPFYGGIGLHDASWRDEFGGSIYMYNGSHGCINLPNYAAGVIYENVSIGTMVIVYGGVRSVSDMQQELTGTSAYDLSVDSTPFTLNVKPKYKGVIFHYSSSDTNVVAVDEGGTVTVVGAGSAEITVTTDAVGVLSEGRFTISITVTDLEPEETEPDIVEPPETEPEQTEPPETEPEQTEPPESESVPT